MFLAAKTTNNPISLEAYTAQIPKTAPSDVLDLEFLVAQSLNFEFSVWHAHRALWGIYLDIQVSFSRVSCAVLNKNSLQNVPDIQLGTLHEAYSSAVKHIHAARLTDAELIYTPSQIALAAFSMASPELAASWARLKGSETALSIAARIEAMIRRDGNTPDVERMRDVDRRLRLCKNPEKVPGSKAFLAKKAEEEAKLKEKRERKAEDVRRAIEAGDPFSRELGMLAGVDGDLDDDD